MERMTDEQRKIALNAADMDIKQLRSAHALASQLLQIAVHRLGGEMIIEQVDLDGIPRKAVMALDQHNKDKDRFRVRFLEV